ncbi:MAG: hypothetical protein ACOX7Q_12120 [Kiritimatiellia bacterium]|jgi:hypothetical protein|nr:hypothetical protein [Planctomycetota bacterium]
MKMFLPLLALISVSMIPIAIQANSIAYYRERVQRLEAEARRMGIEDGVGFIDSYFILGKKEAYVAFQKELAASSEFILTHLDEITSNDYQIAIIAMSTWEMTRATFVAFLNAMADAVEAGKIDRKFFKWAQSPTEGRLSGLLVREYDKPDIQGIVVRSRKIFHDRPDLVDQYDRLLTGESRRKLEQFEAAMREDQVANSKQPRKPIVQKSASQGTLGTLSVTEARPINPSIIDRTEETLVEAPCEQTHPKKHSCRLVLVVLLGCIAILVCVGFLLLFCRKTQERFE